MLVHILLNLLRRGHWASSGDSSGIPEDAPMTWFPTALVPIAPVMRDAFALGRVALEPARGVATRRRLLATPVAVAALLAAVAEALLPEVDRC